MCLYFQFPVVWKRVKGRIGGRRMVDFSIGLAKIDRPAPIADIISCFHPLSGVLHVKRTKSAEARRSYTIVRSSSFYLWIYIIDICRSICLLGAVSYFSLKHRDKDETMDQGIVLQDLGDVSSSIARWGCCSALSGDTGASRVPSRRISILAKLYYSFKFALSDRRHGSAVLCRSRADRCAWLR